MTRILIAGAGIGGLALAQALHRDGHDVAVFERDPSPHSRNQGYRLHIDQNGNAALRACLPPEVLDRVRDTSGVNGDLVAAYTSELHQVIAQEFPGIPESEITNVVRDTFRQALMTGLTDHIHFGRTVSAYRITDRVRVDFAEGGSEEGDLLIGADGVNSAIRRQLLPHAATKDLGIRCLYGRMPVNESTESLIPPDFNRGFCWVSGPNGFGAGFAPVRFRDRPEGYLMTTLVAQADLMNPAGDLWKFAADATAHWHPAIRDLFTHADPASFFPITIRASEPVEAWPSGPVTLLGDAIHTMPPAGGVGANTALQDAASLSSSVRATTSPKAAIAAYERVMLPRGLETVEHSIRMLTQMVRTDA